jgi:lipopolysaccharide/colanic/teichoic acid biosynthesis glycosyltransferase
MRMVVRPSMALGAKAEPRLGCSGAQTLVWRGLDLLLASALLLLFAPVMLVVALAIRIDSPGPALFRQRRLGRDLQPFVMNKFRTMRVHADESIHQAYVRRLIAGEGEAVSDGKRLLYKLAVDDRVTQLGRILRRSSLDELPQLFNVIRGEMSLVGPRPVIPYEAEQFPDWYFDRFVVKPGLTGLWQVSGRNQRTYEEMVAFDVAFAHQPTLRMYVQILARTLWVVVLRRGVA